MSEIKHIPYFSGPSIEGSGGFASDDQAVSAFKLTNQKGISALLTNFGATLVGLEVPLQDGGKADVVLGFDSLDAYKKSFGLPSAPYFGATVGRYAGRIDQGAFPLNGATIQLVQNHGSHSLHGGRIGFSQAIWTVSQRKEGQNPSITFTHDSPNGAENYPGNLAVALTYTLTEDNELMLDYTAQTDRDTIVNLTHHSYFNLDGHQGEVTGQKLFVNSGKILETTRENIPTGHYLRTAHCPFDFTAPKDCPKSIDTTFVLNQPATPAATLMSVKNKLKMLVYTNQPAVHVYVGGNCFGLLKGKQGADYHALSGICFETQNFPDAPNHSHFPSAVLTKGATYSHKTIYKFQNL